METTPTGSQVETNDRLTATITCDRCKEEYEYLDDGQTLDCMPDGVLVNGGPEWVCSDCMVDEDGNTLPEFN